MCMGMKSLAKSSAAGVGTRYLKKKYDKEMEPDIVKQKSRYVPEPKKPKKPKVNSVSSLQITKDY